MASLNITSSWWAPPWPWPRDNGTSSHSITNVSSTSASDYDLHISSNETFHKHIWETPGQNDSVTVELPAREKYSGVTSERLNHIVTQDASSLKLNSSEGYDHSVAVNHSTHKDLLTLNANYITSTEGDFKINSTGVTQGSINGTSLFPTWTNDIDVSSTSDRSIVNSVVYGDSSAIADSVISNTQQLNSTQGAYDHSSISTAAPSDILQLNQAPTTLNVNNSTYTNTEGSSSSSYLDRYVFNTTHSTNWTSHEGTTAPPLKNTSEESGYGLITGTHMSWNHEAGSYRPIMDNSSFITCHGLLCIWDNPVVNYTVVSNTTDHGGGAVEWATTNTAEDTSDPEKNWHMLFLFLIVLVGITGNVLVCIAVTIEKKLHNVTNYFLVSLAIADLFVSLIVMPCSIITELMGKSMNNETTII